MEKDKHKTKVIFRFWRNEVIAIFPEECGNADPYSCSSYIHVGQHGSCDPYHIIGQSRLAHKFEYAGLEKELEDMGYLLSIGERINHVFSLKKRKEKLRE